MNETASASAPALASVIVLKIQGFARRPVAEQAQLKSQLETLVAAAIQPLAPADRIVLEAPDGAAIVALGGPQQALGCAERSQAAAAELPFCIGVNYGPVKPVSDAQRGSGVVGDGVAAAATVAGVATPGRLLASRAFRDALAARSPDSAGGFVSSGTYTDANVRTHELYAPDPGHALARRRRVIVLGALSVIAIIGLGVGLRAMRFAIAPPPPPATIQFEISPHGEVAIDGTVKGKSPPLARLQVSSGKHTIEIRNSSYPTERLEVDLMPGEEITVRHSFAKPRSTGESFKDQVRELRRRLGF